MKIVIKDVLGLGWLGDKEGRKLYNLIHTPLLNGEVVILDFIDTGNFTLSFMHEAFGALVKDIKKEDIYRLLEIKGRVDYSFLESPDIVKLVIENAEKYFRDLNVKFNK